ncbi:hypothetical protein L3Q65_38125 [Amycolatopsis sp. FU40]|uniref:hypothetical protein n=1 Tax=Amycolatopsis sp. FU40 TaxID=2914159 RepID=UPI001F2A3FB0|nr:hypothetical protein [Amycolatopsis sp. FU40]UKD53664.1 hypothetical protein L3Q65_38125 [Amycolatopsis sp. FU40]
MTVRITDEYFRYATRQISIGRRVTMPGIRKCTDCHAFYRTDDTGLTICPDCRPNHDRICTGCGVPFTGQRNGIRLCKSCRDQQALF